MAIEEFQLMNFRKLGPILSISETKFIVKFGPEADFKYFDDKTLVENDKQIISERGEADIQLIISKLRKFLEQFK